MAMAHSVEGRYPFLDYRVVEFCNRLPSELKLKGLTEKWLLKQFGRDLVPSSIINRPKRPYRAPIHKSFFSPKTPLYVRGLLSEEAIRESGYFDPDAVLSLVQKVESGTRMSEIEDMALVGILSTQLVHLQFVRRESGFPSSQNDLPVIRNDFPMIRKIIDHTEPAIIKKNLVDSVNKPV